MYMFMILSLLFRCAFSCLSYLSEEKICLNIYIYNDGGVRRKIKKNENFFLIEMIDIRHRTSLINQPLVKCDAKHRSTFPSSINQ